MNYTYLKRISRADKSGPYYRIKNDFEAKKKDMEAKAFEQLQSILHQSLIL
jgi:hypothetical protein